MWENADQNNSEYGHFLRSVFQKITKIRKRCFYRSSVALMAVYIDRTIDRNKIFQNSVKSSQRMCSIKKAVLKNFAILTGKQLCFQVSKFIKKILQHRCFPMIIAKFSRTLISKNIC